MKRTNKYTGIGLQISAVVDELCDVQHHAHHVMTNSSLTSLIHHGLMQQKPTKLEFG